MIKLIASDIDGTLIQDSTPDLYPEMAQAIRALRKKGILFCAASGRQFFSVQNVFREVADEIAYIVENGAQIRYQGKDISVTPMKKEHIEGILSMLRPFYGKCEVIVSTPKGSLVESKNEEFIHLITHGYHNVFKRVDDVLKEDAEIIKIAVWQKDSIRTLGEGAFIPEWKDRVKACIAGEEWVDFMDASVDKGNALRFLQDYLTIAKEEIMAFGDNDNDIGLMSAAGESYAVETAVEAVKKAATGICPGYEKKGVYKIIKKLL